MLKRIVVVTILTLTACAQEKIVIAEAGTKAYPDYGVFSEYVAEFEGWSGQRVNIPINFAKLEDPSVGMCNWYADFPQNNYIEIDPTHWNKIDKYQRAVILLHELGHCVLIRHHESHYKPNGLPVSIMHSHVLKSEWFKNNRDYYLRELVGLPTL